MNINNTILYNYISKSLENRRNLINNSLRITALAFYIVGCGVDTTNHDPIQLQFEQGRGSVFSEYESAKNDIKKSAAFNKSHIDACKMAKKYGYSFNNWYGEITSLRTDKGGDQVTHLNIVSKAGGIPVEYGSAYDGYKKGTAIYNQLIELGVGENVYFSFTFDKTMFDNPGCYQETSFTEYGGLSAPEFPVTFSRMGTEANIDK